MWKGEVERLTKPSGEGAAPHRRTAKTVRRYGEALQRGHGGARIASVGLVC